MKAIKYILLILLFGFFACNDEMEDNKKTYNGDPFVRFFLLLNSNNQTFDNGVVVNNRLPVESINVDGFNTLKIPVLFSTPTPLSDSLYISIETIANGTFNAFSIEPNKRLVFHNSKISDTITVSFTERWDAALNDSITLKLSESSMPEVHLGNLNSYHKNDMITIHLGEVLTTMQFGTNRVELIGNLGEQVKFNVEFPKGLIKNEVKLDELFEQTHEFDYTLQASPFKDGDKRIEFTLTFNETNSNDFIYLETEITLKQIAGYTLTGNNSLKIIKPVRANRDNTVNTAAHFYNLDDWLNRSYTEQWIDYFSSGECKWRSSAMFTYPVVVDANHPDAILYDDKGTNDESDDIYHHAFRIGFNAPNTGRTTNSFGLKYWFSDEYTDSDKSPGFNIHEALEFFPENGTSDSIGTVLIIPQDLTIAGRSGNQYVIAISGEGTYKKLDNTLFELEFYIDIYSDELFGGTQRGYYKLYNKSVYPEPEARTDGCYVPVDL